MHVRSRLDGLSPLDQELHEALVEEDQRIGREGCHSIKALQLLGGSFIHTVAQPAAQPSDGPQESDPIDGESTPSLGPVDTGNDLRSSDVGRLLAQLTIGTTEEEVARALCTRLVEYVSYQQAVSELPGVVEQLESCQHEMFQGAFQTAAQTAARMHHGMAHATGMHTGSTPPIIPTRTRSLPGSNVCSQSPVQLGHAGHSLPPIANRPGSVRNSSSTKDRGEASSLPPLATSSRSRQARNSSSPGSLGNVMSDSLVAQAQHAAGDAASGSLAPGNAPHQPPAWYGAAALPSSQARSRSLSAHAKAVPKGVRGGQRPSSATIAVCSNALPTYGSSKMQQQGSLKSWAHVSLTAYMIKCLARPGQRQPMRLCALHEWANGSEGAGMGPGGRRAASAGLCQAVQDRIGSMSRQQLDTIRTESRNSMRNQPGATRLNQQEAVAT